MAENEVSEKRIERTKTGSIAGVGGRPPGAKNKTSLVKEAIKAGMEDTLLNYGISVLHATAQAAMGTKLKDADGNYLYDEYMNHVYVGGNDTCKKLILDRMIPIADVTSGKSSGGTSIVVNVQGMETRIDLMDAKTIKDIEHED